MTDQTATPAQAPETVTIKGIVYNVEISETPADVQARGLKYLAAEMTKNHVTRTLYIRRPNGKRLFFVNEFFKYGRTLYNDPYPMI